MGDDLEEELSEWGRSETPPADGAFANRLETSLRREMLEPAAAGRGWSAVFFRPGVVVMAIAVMIFGFAFLSGAVDDVGVAEGSTTTLPTPRTSVIDLTTTSTGPNVAPDVPPITGTSIVEPDVSVSTTAPAEAPSTTDGAPTDQTTIAPTTVPVTTDPPITTIPNSATTIAPAPISDLSAERDGRQLVISWRVDTARSDVAGWVLLRETDREPLEISRDPATRRFVTTITDVDVDYRIEGRNADGGVVFDSGVILFSRDG